MTFAIDERETIEEARDVLELLLSGCLYDGYTGKNGKMFYKVFTDLAEGIKTGIKIAQ